MAPIHRRTRKATARELREPLSRHSAGPVPSCSVARADGGGFESLIRDILYALRSLARAPIVATAAILTLALGIGANTAVFSVVRGVLMRPLPHAEGDRLVYLRQSAELVGVDNVLFSVPQLSVRLEDIPDDHRRMVRFWTSYWRANRATLLDGRFVPRAPMSNYPLVSAHSEAKSIYAVYGGDVVTLDSSVPLRIVDIINARRSDRVVVDAAEDLGRFRYSVHDVLGQELEVGFVDLTRGAHGFDVPPSAVLSFQRAL